MVHLASQKEETPVIPNHKANGGLPPKPEERWKYIKELENRQVTVPSPTEPPVAKSSRKPS